MRTKPEEMPRELCGLDHALFFASRHPQGEARDLIPPAHSRGVMELRIGRLCGAPYKGLRYRVGCAGYRTFLRETSWLAALGY